MSTLSSWSISVTPGQISRLNVGLLLSEAAVAGDAWRSSVKPPSPSALTAHLTAAPLGGCCAAFSVSRSERERYVVIYYKRA